MVKIISQYIKTLFSLYIIYFISFNVLKDVDTGAIFNRFGELSKKLKESFSKKEKKRLNFETDAE